MRTVKCAALDCTRQVELPDWYTGLIGLCSIECDIYWRHQTKRDTPGETPPDERPDEGERQVPPSGPMPGPAGPHSGDVLSAAH